MGRKRELLELLLIFMKIGLFTFGGGLAMLSMMEYHCAEKKKWVTHDDIMNVAVIAQSTPGPVAINCATFVGYRQAGLIGAFIATFGLVFPSFVLIYLLSMFLEEFLGIGIVANAFRGIEIGVGILMLNTGINAVRKVQKNLIPFSIMSCSFVIMLLNNLFSWKLSSVNLILASAVISFLNFLICKESGEKGGVES